MPCCLRSRSAEFELTQRAVFSTGISKRVTVPYQATSSLAIHGSTCRRSEIRNQSHTRPPFCTARKCHCRGPHSSGAAPRRASSLHSISCLAFNLSTGCSTSLSLALAAQCFRKCFRLEFEHKFWRALLLRLHCFLAVWSPTARWSSQGLVLEKCFFLAELPSQFSLG